MRLSELKTGESATIVKVMGHGGFRRRIMEMGFVRGQRVEVILNAPLKDPIEYKIMGYDISLRRTEAGWKWATAAVAYNTVLAWVVAWAVYRLFMWL